MDLPRELQPWSEQLAIFPHDISLSIGALVRRLSVIFSPLRINQPYGAEEPDGISGLQTKAAYERLLTSEWMLAEELPEEFERRAVMGEHLFYRRHTSRSSESSVSIVLFDCGPYQIGPPRIVQLALLVLLQRRAQLANAEFYWGILQDSQRALHSKFSKESVWGYLKSRSASVVDHTMLAEWDKKFAELDKVNEVWMVSEAAIEFLAYQPKIIQIIDEYDTSDNTLTVVVNNGRLAKQVQLEMPHDAICTRLLRDPFEIAQADMQKINLAFSSQSPLLFGLSGSKLLIDSDDKSLISYPIPNSPLAQSGKPRKIDKTNLGYVVAAQIMKKRCMLITKSEDMLYFHNVPGMRWNSSLSLSANPKIKLAHSRISFRTLHYSYQTGYVHSLFIVDDANQLVRFTWDKNIVEATIVSEDVIAVGSNGKKVDYVSMVAKNLPALFQANVYYKSRAGTPIDLKKPLSGKAFIAVRRNASESNDIVALELEDRTWKIVCGDNSCILNPFQNTEVIGIYAPCGRYEYQRDYPIHSLGLVVINQDRASISVVSRTVQLNTPKETSKIVHAVYNLENAMVAYILKNNTLKVYSFVYEKFLLTVKGEHEG